jgi:hypothetical protein
MRHVLAIFAVLTYTTASFALPSKPIERAVNTLGVRARVTLTQLSADRVLVEVRTGRQKVTDTVAGRSLYPLLVNGTSQPFYLGRFGASRLPMIIFGVTDPDRVQDSRVIAYQVSSGGALIGQQVVLDDAMRHGHSDDVSGGRYQLASVDPQLGAIYSISYQDARFDGFFVTYEKLRVRQWDPAIGAFIETDQGFLREKNGKLVEAAKFHGLNDRARGQVFAANLRDLREIGRAHLRPATKATPVSTMR